MWGTILSNKIKNSKSIENTGYGTLYYTLLHCATVTVVAIYLCLIETY